MAGRGFVKGEADHLHPEPTELDMGIGKRGDFTNPVAPLGERLFALAGIGADRERAADMVHHDRRLRKGPREIDEVVELGLEHPSVEGEAERRESREAFAEVVIQ